MISSRRAFDFFGNIVVVKFPRNTSLKEKRKFAENLMRENKAIKTILEKTDKFKGRLRKMTTKYLLGENTKEVLYRENDCIFRFNLDNVYFSPRLSNERKEVANEIEKLSKGKKVRILVMFSGVGPFAIVIAKKCKNCSVVGVEINKEAYKYSLLNKKLNNLRNLEFIQGDIKRITPHLILNGYKFDFIIMPRPQLKETFLKQTFQLSKSRTKIYYYDFCKNNEMDNIVEKIEKEAKKNKKLIKIANIKKAGEIGPYKFRVRMDFILQ